MGGGLRGFIATRASLLQGNALPFVGPPPSGRWVVVCEGFRDEGVAPRGNALNVGHLQARQGAAPTTTVTMRSGCKTRAMAR